jgi:hypothetical protein
MVEKCKRPNSEAAEDGRLDDWTTFGGAAPVGGLPLG